LLIYKKHFISLFHCSLRLILTGYDSGMTCSMTRQFVENLTVKGAQRFNIYQLQILRYKIHTEKNFVNFQSPLSDVTIGEKRRANHDRRITASLRVKKVFVLWAYQYGRRSWAKSDGRIITGESQLAYVQVDLSNWANVLCLQLIMVHS